MTAAMLEAFLLAAALAGALALQPWRLLRRDPSVGQTTPMLGTLALLPFVWGVPFHGERPMALCASGACLVVLTVGWPLAVPLLAAVGLIVWQLDALPAAQALATTVWLGIVPATLALALGWAVRRWLGTHALTYLAGRAYFGTMLCSFIGMLAAYLLHGAAASGPTVTHMLALGLVSVAEAAVTAGVVVLLVTCLPRAVATWSDRLYLKPAVPEGG